MLVNGINVLQLSARDVYAVGLQLLDVMFTKEEQSCSLLFASKKSTRVGLDGEHVDKLLGELPFNYSMARMLLLILYFRIYG